MVRILGPNDPALEALKRSIELHPNVDCELTIVAWEEYRAKLDAVLASETPEYDVVSIPGHIWLPQLANDGLLQPFEALAGKVNAEVIEEYNAADIYASIQHECRFRGQQYVLPLFTDGHIIFYRSDVVSLPEKVNPADWRSILSEVDPPAGMKAFAMKAHASEIFLDFLPTFWDLGAELWSEDGKALFASELAAKALEYYRSLREFCDENTHQFGNGEILDAINSGKAAIVASWGGQAAGIFDEKNNPNAKYIRTAALRNAWNATWGVSIPSKVAPQKAAQALEVLMRLMGKEGDRLVTEIAGSPVRVSSYSAEEKAKYPWLGSQQKLLEECRILPTDPAFGAYLGPLYTEVYNAFIGTKTVVSALNDAAKQ